MKTTYLFFLLLSSLLILNACSDDSSTNAPTPTSPITGSWEMSYELFVGGQGLTKKIEATFTLVENNGVITGNAEITYINNEGLNNVEMIINDSVTGTFKENITPHIILNASNGAFIFTGNWVDSRKVNFNGLVTVNYNQETFNESDLFLFKSED